MDLTGKIIAILPASSGVSARTGNSWMSQDYVIEVPGQFPRRMVFRVFGEDRIKQFNLQAGEDVTVQFDIDAHEYQGRWFNDIRAFNVFRGEPAQSVPAATTFGAPAQPADSPFPPAQPAAAPAAQPAAPAAPFAPAPAQDAAPGESTDDLPF